MSELKGVKFIKDASGRNRYVRIDLDMYGENQRVEDFLDLLYIESRKGCETISLEELNQYIDKRI